MVDKEEDTEDLHKTKDACLLPGEVEEDFPAYSPAFCHHTELELSSINKGHRGHTPSCNAESQSKTEEVVVFYLDDTFDYENAVLSHYPVKSSNCGSL